MCVFIPGLGGSAFSPFPTSLLCPCIFGFLPPSSCLWGGRKTISLHILCFAFLHLPPHTHYLHTTTHATHPTTCTENLPTISPGRRRGRRGLLSGIPSVDIYAVKKKGSTKSPSKDRWRGHHLPPTGSGGGEAVPWRSAPTSVLHAAAAHGTCSGNLYVSSASTFSPVPSGKKEGCLLIEKKIKLTIENSGFLIKRNTLPAPATSFLLIDDFPSTYHAMPVYHGPLLFPIVWEELCISPMKTPSQRERRE